MSVPLQPGFDHIPVYLEVWSPSVFPGFSKNGHRLAWIGQKDFYCTRQQIWHFLSPELDSEMLKKTIINSYVLLDLECLALNGTGRLQKRTKISFKSAKTKASSGSACQVQAASALNTSSIHRDLHRLLDEEGKKLWHQSGFEQPPYSDRNCCVDTGLHVLIKDPLSMKFAVLQQGSMTETVFQTCCSEGSGDTNGQQRLCPPSVCKYLPGYLRYERVFSSATRKQSLDIALRPSERRSHHELRHSFLGGGNAWSGELLNIDNNVTATIWANLHWRLESQQVFNTQSHPDLFGQ